MSLKRPQQIHAFHLELEQLKQDGVLSLSAEQQERIKNYYAQLGSKQLSSSQQLSMAMRLSTLFAALALSSAAYFFLQLFWHQMVLSAQLLIAIASPLLFLFAAQFASKREQDAYFPRLFAVLSWFCFMLNISLLTDLFNLSPSTSALLLYGAYALILAYLYQSKLLCSLALLLVSAFVVSKFHVSNLLVNDMIFEKLELYFLPAALIFFIAKFTPFFSATYRGTSWAIILLCCLLLAWIPSDSLLNLSKDTIESMYHILGLAISIVAISFGIRKAWHESYKIGVFFFIVFLYSKVISWWASDILPAYLFFLLIGLLAVLCLLVFKRLHSLQQGRLA